MQAGLRQTDREGRLISTSKPQGRGEREGLDCRSTVSCLPGSAAPKLQLSRKGTGEEHPTLPSVPGTLCCPPHFSQWPGGGTPGHWLK